MLFLIEGCVDSKRGVRSIDGQRMGGSIPVFRRRAQDMHHGVATFFHTQMRRCLYIRLTNHGLKWLSGTCMSVRAIHQSSGWANSYSYEYLFYFILYSICIDKLYNNNC